MLGLPGPQAVEATHNRVRTLAAQDSSYALLADGNKASYKYPLTKEEPKSQ